jgi:hypothetical protein
MIFVTGLSVSCFAHFMCEDCCPPPLQGLCINSQSKNMIIKCKINYVTFKPIFSLIRNNIVTLIIIEIDDYAPTMLIFLYMHPIKLRYI